MKKLVTLLTVGCCLVMSSTLFSSNFEKFSNKLGDSNDPCTAIESSEAVGNCGSLSGLSFYASDETADPGDPVYVTVTAQDFKNIAAFSWTMFYDSTVIKLDSATNEVPESPRNPLQGTIPAFGEFRVDGSGFANVNHSSVGFPLQSTLPPVSDYPAGTNKALTIIWATPNGSPLSKPDGCVDLFYLCFEAIGSGGASSPVVFFDQPSDIDINDGTNQVNLPLSQFVAGSVTMAGGSTTPGPLNFDLTSTSIDAGATKCFPVRANGLQNYSRAANSFTWDENVLEYKEVKAFNLAGLDMSDFDVSNTNSGELNLAWTAPGLIPTSVSNGTNIYEVCFEAKGAAGSTSSYELEVQVAGTTGGGTLPSPSTGTITVNSVAPPPAMDDCGTLNGLSFYASNESVEPGDPVYVRVNAQDFTNIAAFSWTMYYDSTVIRLDSATNEVPETPRNPLAGTIPAFGEFRVDGSGFANVNHSSVGFPLQSTLPPVSDYPAGTNKALTVIWATPNGSPLTKPSCTDLFYLCFKAIGSLDTSSPIAFSDKPSDIDINDGTNQVNVPLSQFVAGSVRIETTGKPAVRVNMGNLALEEGENKCIPVTVRNFNKLKKLQHTISYDKSVVEYTRVKSLNLAGLTASNFTHNANGGYVEFDWDSPSAGGTDVSDNTVIYEICFDAVGSGGSSGTVGLTSTPTASLAIDFEDETLSVTGTSSTVSINSPVGACGSLNGLSFYASSETVEENDAVYVSVRAQDFTDIAAFSWTMYYDSTVIRLDSATNEVPLSPRNPLLGTIPSFGEFRIDGSGFANVNHSSVGFPLQSTLPPVSEYPAGTNKALTVVWATSNGNPISKNDCDVIFYLCFKAIGNINTGTTIAFSDKPSDIDINDGTNQINVPLSQFVSGQVNIEDSAVPPGAPDDVNVTDVLCKDDATGRIVVTYPNGPYSFAWTGGLNGKTISNLQAGVYDLTITDTDTGLESDFTYTVTEPNTSVSASGNITNELDCFGDNDGAISINATGGTGAYTYNWTGNASGANPSNLMQGTYSVQVEDANGCSTSGGSYTLNQPDRLTIPAPMITDVTCGGGDDGRIILVPAGGTAPYSYNWSPALTPVRNPSNLTEGDYTVVVTDDNNCTASGTYSVGAADPIVISGMIVQHSTSGNNGIISTNVTGGSTQLIPLIISWTGPPGFFSDELTIQNLVPAQYCLTISDEKGCSETECFTIDNQIPKAEFDEVDLNESCFGEATGSIVATFTGGLNPTVEILTVPGNLPVANTGLEGGRNYLVQLSDQGAVCDQRTVFLREFGQIVVTGTVEDDTASGNGEIAVNATNTVGALTYSWDPNVSSSNIADGLSGGTYSVTVTDGTTGCSGTESFTIENKRPVIIDDSRTSVIHVKCPSGDDGSFTVNWTQGVGPFDIEVTGRLTDQAQVAANRTFFTQNNLPAGDYVVTIIDIFGNRVMSSTITINQPNAFTASAKITPRTATVGGSIDLTVTGGTQPYTFRWNDNQNQTVEDPINLQNGSYSCTVTDANGCTFTTPTFNVGSFQFSDTDVKDSDCEVSENGSITVEVEGGNLPYIYDWNGPGTFSANTAQIVDLAPGDYTVVVTDDFGAVITEDFTIETQSTISATAAMVSGVNCFGGTDGSANVMPANGAAPYNYQWSTGTNPTAQQVNGLSAGTATVIVTDDLGCQTTATVTLTEPEQITVSADMTGNLCFGDRNGSAIVNIVGGTPTAGSPRYSIFWDDPELSGTRLNALPSGNYTAMIEDARGCEEEVTVTIGGPTEPLSALIETTDDEDGLCTGSARAEVVGGTPPYFYHWSVPADTIIRELTDLCSGDYGLTVSDANGCEKVATVATIINKGIPCLSTRAVMTPNEDGLNDEFIIYCIEDYPNNTLEVYNRWGQLVWEQDSYDNTWTGTTLRGSNVPDGAYFFVFRYNQGGEIRQKKGSFSLLRK